MIQFPQLKIGQGGQAALTAVIILLGISLAIVGGFASLALGQEHLEQTRAQSEQGFFASEAAQEDVLYRLNTGRAVSDEEVLTLAGAQATTTITDTQDGKRIVAQGGKNSHIRRVQTDITISDEVRFNYGVQIGDGGLEMRNQSSISGNVYSNGPVTGQGNIVGGSVISAGENGLVDDIHATSSVYAHTVQNAFVEQDAYYQQISNTTVLGSEFPGSSDQPTSTLSIPDSLVEEWKQAAEDGGTLACSDDDEHEVEDDTTLGPVKIPCDLEISGSPTVTLAGPVWVLGDIDITNNAIVRVADSIGAKSVPVIADDPNATDELIRSRNKTSFAGSGDENSHVLLLSQNSEAESGGGGSAIEIDNQSDAGNLLVYAGHGRIVIKNQTVLREVTAYAVRTQNSAEVIYKTGLSNVLFESGPGGGYDIVGWKEVE